MFSSESHSSPVYLKALKKAEEDVNGMLCNQITDQESIHYGGVRSVDTWDVNYHDTAALYVWSVRLYLLKDSTYYKDEKLYERIQMAYQYCMNWKHEDGTKDYIDCDFHTGAGSEVQNMAKAIHIIDKHGTGEKKELLRQQMVELMQALAQGLVTGGFNTPNHRWIYSGALAAANSIAPDVRYLDKINLYLQEGFDCDEDGEYAERSAGIYSYVTNEGLILMARYLNRPDIYEYVRRNLHMLRYYMEPDGSIFTMNSTRQDQGTRVWAEKYLSEYLYIGDIFDDEVLKETADRLFLDAEEKGREIPLSLEFLLLNEQFINYRPAKRPQKKELLEKYFKNANIMRRTEADSSLTLIPDSKTFLYASFGDIDLFMRMSGHFFKVRNIAPQQITVTEKGYRLRFTGDGSFKLPFREKPETSDWWKMDHSKRDYLRRPNLEVALDIMPTEEGIDFSLSTKTGDNVPFRIEIGISPNCLIRGKGFMCKAQPGMWMIPTEGTVTAETLRNGIEIGEVFGEHGKVTGREGSAPRSGSHMTIYLNQYCTDKPRVFHIKRIKQEGLS